MVFSWFETNRQFAISPLSPPVKASDAAVGAAAGAAELPLGV
jgi:hypothetical protein